MICIFNTEKKKIKKPNQSLKQTGRADATVKHFIFGGVLRGIKLSQSAPSGSLALR